VEAGIFSAEEVGATHQRKRVFLLAELANPGSEGLQRRESPQTAERAYRILSGKLADRARVRPSDSRDAGVSVGG